MKYTDLAGIEFVVDDREPEDFLLAMAELGATKKRMDHHDVIVGPFGVERKEIADFFASIFDDRLIMQQATSQESGKNRVLIVEGSPQEAFMWRKVGGAANMNLYYAMLAKLTAMGVSIVHTYDMRGTQSYISSLLDRAKKPVDTVEEQVIKIKRVSTYEAMLRQIPGVGQAKAEAIMERWPNLPTLVKDARLYQLVDIVGVTLGPRIYEVLHPGEELPRVYSVLSIKKASEVCLKFPELDQTGDVEADWEAIKDEISAHTANKLWEAGLAERKNQEKLS